MLDRDRFVKDFIRQLFWTQTTDFDTTAFETEENKEIVNRAIDIARQQMPDILFIMKRVFGRDVFYCFAWVRITFIRIGVRTEGVGNG